MKWILSFLALICMCQASAADPFEGTKNLPVAFQGRFRSLEPASRLWLYDAYHSQQIKQEDAALFQATERSALNLMWKIHMLGPSFMDTAPLFWIHYAEVKNILGLDIAKTRFSYKELFHAFFEKKESNLKIMQMILPYEFVKAYLSPSNRSQSTRLTLTSLSPELSVGLQDNRLFVTSAPKSPPWNFLSTNFQLTSGSIDLEQIEKQSKAYSEELIQLLHHLKTYQTLSSNTYTDKHSDIKHIIQNAGHTLNMLPTTFPTGEWVSLHALDNLPANTANFTLFSEDDFQALRLAYIDLKNKAMIYFEDSLEQKNGFIERSLKESVDHFSKLYEQAYTTLLQHPYQTASNKQLYYPSPLQLQIETMYYRLPLIEISLIAYCITILLFIIRYTTKRRNLFRWALGFLFSGLSIHTLILVLRCYVLGRPPVSNMFETVIYVPWIAILLGLILFATLRNEIILFAATAASAGLLIVLKLADVDSRMENVQAILDSQYWLIVHVLMIVASYGVFIVCGVLAHAFLVGHMILRHETPAAKFIATCILQTMYIGIALLVPGTILGGVWAAESWGRFWDWDPKESWAFITACIYVLIIHAYTFKKIRDFGLAVGAIVGLMAVSFTWYGVNYILGTGLHSYGFGSGGEVYYYGYLMFEAVFLLIIGLKRESTRNSEDPKSFLDEIS